MKYLYLAFLPLLLTACNDESEPKHEVGYYKINNDERIAKLEWCEEKRERKSTFNCRSAIDAKAQLSTDLLLGDGIQKKPLVISQ